MELSRLLLRLAAALTLAVTTAQRGQSGGTGNGDRVVFPDSPSVSPLQPPDADSLPCDVRASCTQGDPNDWRTSNIYYRNCFCDDLCGVYDDCCADHMAPPRQRHGDFRLAKSTITCRRVPEVQRENAIYIVQTCPKEYTDSFVMSGCQTDNDTAFFNLPVSGRTTGILYRNYYCAVCAGEVNITFWQPEVNCDVTPAGDDAAILTSNLMANMMDHSCYLKYSHSVMRPRMCKEMRSRCHKSFNKKKVERKCKLDTSYMYANYVVFKNKHCAECNFVNETYLSCTDPRSPWVSPNGGTGPMGPMGATEGGGIVPLSAPFSILFDVTEGRATFRRSTFLPDNTREDTLSVVSLKDCPFTHVYDPVARICRPLICREVYDGQDVEQQCLGATRTNVSHTTVVPTSPVPTTQADITSMPANEEVTQVDNVVPMTEPTWITTAPPTTTTTTTMPSTTPRRARGPRTRPTKRKPKTTTTKTIYGGEVPDTPAPRMMEEDCTLRLLDHNQYHMMHNRSIYVISLERMYHPFEYVLEQDGVLLCASSPSDGDYSYEDGDMSDASEVLSNTSSEAYMVLMFQYDRIQSLVSVIGVLISLCALFIFMVVYALLPALRSLSGRCVFSLVVALFLAQLLYLAGLPRTEHPVVCLTLSALMHYCWLASFFWLNVLAADTCRTLSCKTVSAAAERQISPRFTYYSLYAWLSPAMVVGASLALDLVELHELYRPRYAVGMCWLTSRHGLLILFALPITLILVTNIVLHCLTIRGLCLYTEVSKYAQQQRAKERSRFFLYVKLSLLMGLTWIFAFVAALTRLWALWYAFIVLNMLQGVFICIAFICTRKVFRLLRDKGKKPAATGTNSNGRYANHGGPPRHHPYTRHSYLYDGEAKIISQETSI